MQPVTATCVDTLRHLGNATEREVLTGDFVPGPRNSHLGIIPVAIPHTHGTQHAPGRGGFTPNGNCETSWFQRNIINRRSRTPLSRAGAARA
jgi:hypothetical protein